MELRSSVTSSGTLTSLMFATRPGLPQAQHQDHQWEAEKCSIECIHTTCASPVWDPFTANNIKALEKVQRHATRWVKPDYRRSMCGHHVRNKVLDWPTLGQRRRQAHLTSFYKFHHGLIHIKSKHCPSLTDCRRRTTRHTHYLIYDIPRLNFLGPSRSGTAFCKKWPQHTPSAPLWPGSAAS